MRVGVKNHRGDTLGFSRQASEVGSALIVVLVTATIVGIAMASYLSLVSSQHRFNTRSLAWNTCIPVLEAGIEEALTQIHHTPVTKLSVNGWELGLDGLYHKSRLVGSDGSYFSVTIQPVEPPVIVSSGYVPAPYSHASQLGTLLSGAPPQPVFVKRKVRVTTKRHPFWNFVMLAKGQIKLSGNNTATDSFDSQNPLYSTNGKYDKAKNKDHGDVASNGGGAKVVNSGNANIEGKVLTGLTGSANVSKNGSVGDESWVEGGKAGLQPGHYFNDMNLEIPDVELPSDLPTIVYPGSYPVVFPTGTTNYTYLLVGSPTEQPLFLKSSSLGGKVYVTGNVALWVTDTFSFAGKDSIYLAPGAKLQVYVGAASANIGGSLNSGSALDFQYYGLKSNKSLSLAGNSAFTGSIYAPDAAFTMNGGGSTIYDFVGAVVALTINVNGHFNFHYDEALARGPYRGYLVDSWNEIAPNSP